MEGRGIEDTPPRTAKRGIASYASEAGKHISSAYIGFYHRHDAAGCIHTGLALASLSGLQISADKASMVRDKLLQARQYCVDDKITRHQVIKSLRDSLKIIHGHSLVNAD